MTEIKNQINFNQNTYINIHTNASQGGQIFFPQTVLKNKKIKPKQLMKILKNKQNMQQKFNQKDGEEDDYYLVSKQDLKDMLQK